MLIKLNMACLTNPPEIKTYIIKSTPANSPKPREVPKLNCFRDTPRKRENRSKKRMRPSCTMRTERCRVVTAWTNGLRSTEFEKATHTETSSITTPAHLNSRVPRSFHV